MKDKNKIVYPEILSAAGLDYYPLSFQQERVWYLSQLSPESTVWNKLSCKYLKGKLDIPLLKKALEELTKRHPVLKTRVYVVENEVCQKPDDNFIDYFQVIDKVVLKKSLWEEELQKQLNHEVEKAVDVQGKQLFWAKLIQFSETDSVFFFKLHHIISDATAFQILWRDLKSIYNSLLIGETVSTKSSLQYYDYAVWQRKLFESPLVQEQASYFKDKFSGDIPLLNLPIDFPPNSQMNWRGAMERQWLSKELTQKLFNLSLKNRVILFSTLLSTYYILLYQYCRQEDIVVGTVFSGRHYHNTLRNLLGFYVNTVAIRMHIDSELSFEELLQNTHHEMDQTYKNQDYPFERLIQKINPDRKQKGNPLFRTAFNMVTNTDESINFTGIEEERWVEPEVNSSQFDLMLDIVNENSQNIEVRFEYNTSVFKKETIQRLLRNYIHLLSVIVNEPERKIKDLNCLHPFEREKVVYEWNNTKAEYEGDKCIHELFEKQVELTPDAIALTFEGEEMTYYQLNHKADRLAGFLKKQGIGANTFVGVLLNRSFEMVIGVLGILKAGGAYVPFEPSFPDARIKNIVKDLKVKCMVTQQKYAQRVQQMQEDLLGYPGFILLDKETQRVKQPVDGGFEHASQVKASSEDIAYVIYTSGSTGVPKGVAVKHKPVVNLIQWVNESFGVSSKDKLLFITSLCFDLSVYDIFGILAAGGSIRIVSNIDTRNPERLLDMIKDENITFWDSAPAALQQLVPFLEDEKYKIISRNLRLVFMSGDWIPITLPNFLKSKFPGIEVISLGGATEATVWSNYYRVDELDPAWVSIPYGKPIQNAQYYVLDLSLSPCPIGVPGDLYIGGECLAVGYVNDPDLTSQKFLKNPFEEGEHSIIYKTGDLARWYPDGNLEFLGRQDYQVKIRGFRIELGEIESQLRKCLEIKDVLVMTRVEQQKEKYLCVYYVSDHNIDTDKLRAILSKQLPEYMIPSFFVCLDKMPMTSNGKIDRNALPHPEPKIEVGVGCVEPRNPIELRIAEIWKEILKVDTVGIHDNFFNLGGHSLLATQLILRVREAFHLNIPLSMVLDFPTVGKFSNYVEKSLSITEIKGINKHFETNERVVGKI